MRLGRKRVALHVACKSLLELNSFWSILRMRRVVMPLLMRPMLEGFTQRDCVHTDVLVQLTTARHGNHYKGMEMQGVKNPRRDCQMCA